MKNIVVTGSLAFDYIMDFPGVFADHIMPDKIHKLNLSFYLDTMSKQRGGNAGNISYTLSLLKMPVTIVSVAGSDFGEYKKFLKNAGIDTTYIKIIKDESTATAFMMTDKKNNQISGFYPGAIKKADILSLKNAKGDFGFAIISPDNPNAMISFCKESKELDIRYLFDPGMQLPVLSDEQLIEGIQDAEILIGNDYEMELIKKRIGESALKKIKILITTLGEKGSEIYANDKTISVSVCKPKKVVDPTGAGDAYRSGFVAGFMRGLSLKTCGQMGAVTAAYAIEHYGTQNHKFTIEEFKKRYVQSFNEVLKL